MAKSAAQLLYGPVLVYYIPVNAALEHPARLFAFLGKAAELSYEAVYSAGSSISPTHVAEVYKIYCVETIGVFPNLFCLF